MFFIFQRSTYYSHIKHKYLVDLKLVFPELHVYPHLKEKYNLSFAQRTNLIVLQFHYKDIPKMELRM